MKEVEYPYLLKTLEDMLENATDKVDKKKFQDKIKAIKNAKPKYIVK